MNKNIDDYIVGTCESCGKQIKRSDKYNHDSEGIVWHKKCPPSKNEKVAASIIAALNKGLPKKKS